MTKHAGRHVFTSESVSEGHPDKVADQISDAVLDACLAKDPRAHVACETMCGPGLVVNMGEISCKGFETVNTQDIARRVVSAVRATRARYGLSPKTELEVAVRAPEADAAVLDAQRSFISNVGRVSALELGADLAKPQGSVSVVDGTLEIFVKVGEFIDLAAEGTRLAKELAKAEKDLAAVERTLSNEGFVAKAAPEIIEKKRGQQAELAQTVETLKSQIADLA